MSTGITLASLSENGNIPFPKEKLISLSRGMLIALENCFSSLVGMHCVKSVQIRSFFWSVFSPNAGKYGPEKTPYLDTFHAVMLLGPRALPRLSALITSSISLGDVGARMKVLSISIVK